MYTKDDNYYGEEFREIRKNNRLINEELSKFYRIYIL
jgi:hypothetical protein